MLPLSPVEILEALLPGLIALTSILVVVIAFLFERCIEYKDHPDGYWLPYAVLAILLVIALVVSASSLALSLLYLLGWVCGTQSYFAVLVLFGISISIIVGGVIGTGYIVLRERFR